jgi:hypothetical protein
MVLLTVLWSKEKKPVAEAANTSSSVRASVDTSLYERCVRQVPIGISWANTLKVNNNKQHD